jgi:hypothetical protein
MEHSHVGRARLGDTSGKPQGRLTRLELIDGEQQAIPHLRTSIAGSI